MSSLDKRRDDVARTQNARADLFLFSRKAQIEKEIQTLLRDKTINMIDSSLQLSLLRRVIVLLSTLIVKKTMNVKFKEMNKRLKSIEQNISKTTTTIESYVATTKTNSKLEKNATTIELAKFINLNQQRQLNELKKNKTFIYKIKEEDEKTNIKTLFIKKLIKRIMRAEKHKKNILTIKRLFNEDIKILTRLTKTKQRLKRNKTLLKDVASTTFLSRRIFEIMIHDVKMTSINTQNQQTTIKHIVKQNASMHSNLKITRVIWSKRAKIISNKKYFSLIMKIYNAATINRLIKKKLLNEYSHRTCEYFDKNCKLKQCFNCQRYDHIEKSCKYERRCAACASSHNDSTCTTSIERRKCVNCDENHSIWSFQCKIKIEEKNKLNDMWFFKSILHSKEARKINIASASKEHHCADEKTKRSCVQTAQNAAIESFSLKKEFSSFLNTKIMCLKIDNYTVQKSLNKQSSSQKSKTAIFSSTTRRRSVSVLQMISSQNVNNALTALRYKFFEKKSRERSRQQNANNTTTTNTQNEELWIRNER